MCLTKYRSIQYDVFSKKKMMLKEVQNIQI